MTLCAHIAGDDAENHPLFESLLRLAQQKPLDRFVVFCEKDQNESLPNFVTVKSPAGRFWRKLWYQMRLPSLIKKYKSTLFIGVDATLNTSIHIPQYLFFAEDPTEMIGETGGSKTGASLLAKAKLVFATEDIFAAALKEKYRLPAEKVVTVYHGLPRIDNNNFVAAELIKNKFTDGNDYFACAVEGMPEADIVLLLKAFSSLKKMQKTQIKLVLLFSGETDETAIPNFKHYKYRDEVVLISLRAKNGIMLLHHAYAMICLTPYSSANEAFYAMGAGVPVITVDNVIDRSIWGDAALLTIKEQGALSEKMQVIYKDEFLRARLVDASRMLSQKYDAVAAANALSQTLFGESN